MYATNFHRNRTTAQILLKSMSFDEEVCLMINLCIEILMVMKSVILWICVPNILLKLVNELAKSE